MIRNVAEINWHYIGDAIPAFLTLIMIPYTYNIAYGLIGGILSFVIINGFAWLLDVLTGGRTVPPGYHTDREVWSLPPGGLAPRWLRKLLGGDRRFWVDDGEPGQTPYLQQQRALALQMCAQQHSQMVENPHARKFRHSSTTGSVTGNEGDLEALGGGILLPVMDVNTRCHDADATSSDGDRTSVHTKPSSFHDYQQSRHESARPRPRSLQLRRVDTTRRGSVIEIIAPQTDASGTIARVPPGEDWKHEDCR